ncbi:hypothetical protein [Pollutibacter soli]|uniref:hypothetical protein n=1 Tax=Pollutibacter soli TaxID=3034157 RepID=UPI00301339E4
MKVQIRFLLIMFSGIIHSNLFAQEKPSADAQALADKLANPVASMISVPFQNNTDWGIGTYNGSKNTLNIQPVIPIKLSSNLNLITRYILPVVDQRDITGNDTHQFGLSDMTVSAWASPAQPKNGLIWGFGPALLVPTATDKYLGTEKFGAGPTALVLKQGKGMTIGFLVNQLWSVAGNGSRQPVNQMFLQPFFARSFASGASLGGNFELTQNWQASTTTLFFNPTISGITKIGKQPIQMAIGPRIPLAGPEASKPKFGIRAVLIFVFAG